MPAKRLYEGIMCSIDGCLVNADSLGWCKRHYERNRRIGEPGPLKSGARRNYHEDKSWCADCQEYSPNEMFNKNRSHSHGYGTYCKVHEGERKIRYTYGVEAWQKDIMFHEQQGKCASCLNMLGSVNKAHLDHCHETLTVRALLCFNCNNIEGVLKKVNHPLHPDFLNQIQVNLKMLKE